MLITEHIKDLIILISVSTFIFVIYFHIYNCKGLQTSTQHPYKCGGKMKTSS